MIHCEAEKEEMMMKGDLGILFLKIPDTFRCHQTKDPIGREKIDLMFLLLLHAPDLAAYHTVRPQKVGQMFIEILS